VSRKKKMTCFQSYHCFLKLLLVLHSIFINVRIAESSISDYEFMIFAVVLQEFDKYSGRVYC
jgi:hypothetical protein